MRDEKALKKLLKDLRAGRISTDHAAKRLKGLITRDMGFARIDGARSVRCGFPEVIYGEGKTVDQISKIAVRILKETGRILITRISRDKFRVLCKKIPSLSYNEKGRIPSVIKKRGRKKIAGEVLIITAGTADIPVAEEAAVTVEAMGCEARRLFDVGVAGLHRLMDHADIIMDADAIVVVAGMEGALASVVGGLVSKPVIAVPTSVGYGASFGGIAPLLTMLNSCAPNVAVVNIDNGFGAGYIAGLINMRGR